MLLNNEKGAGAFLIPEQRISTSRQRATFGRVWSSELVDKLLEIYSLEELFWFAREASENGEASDDGTGD